MRARDLTHNGEPEAGAIRAAGHEGLEQTLADALGHAGPGIANA